MGDNSPGSTRVEVEAMEEELLQMSENDDGVISDGLEVVPPANSKIGNKAAATPSPLEKSMMSLAASAVDSAFGKIIVVEPTGTDQNITDFLGKSLQLTTILNSSPFRTAGIVDVRTNFRKKRITVQVKSCASVPELLGITTLGPYQVKCYQPVSHSELRGVIGPVGTGNTEQEILEALQEQNDAGITHVFRLTKGKERQPTLNVKVVFSIPVLPKILVMNYERFKVRPFTENPLQCYKCQAFGHGANNCKGNEKCVVCAGRHRLSDCPKSRPICCANCGKNHTASYMGCQKAKEAKVVEKVRVKNKLTYSEALSVMRTAKKEQLDAGGLSQGHTLSDRPTFPARQYQVEYNDVACQTVFTVDTQVQVDANSAGCSKISEVAMSLPDPDEKFCTFIVGLLSAFSKLQGKEIEKKTPQEQVSLAMSVMQNVYGKKTPSMVPTAELEASSRKHNCPGGRSVSDSSSGTDSPIQGAGEGAKACRKRKKTKKGLPNKK
jgi:hypothetical protein